MHGPRHLHAGTRAGEGMRFFERPKTHTGFREARAVLVVAEMAHFRWKRRIAQGWHRTCIGYQPRPAPMTTMNTLDEAGGSTARETQSRRARDIEATADARRGETRPEEAGQ